MTDWTGCYDDGWGELIVPEAYQHPAKYRPGLIARIYTHGFACGWWSKGDVIGDCFGGIGGGGIYAAYNGLVWRGVELEPQFVELAGQNFAKHKAAWTNGGDPIPEIIQGDSREFAKLVGCSAVVTSPPFADTGPMGKSQRGYPALSSGKDCEHTSTTKKAGDTVCTACGLNLTAKGTIDDYGSTPGQLGNTSGESYWQAMHVVYAQCHQAIQPGGVMAVVVKDFVRGGKRVLLCDQTLAMLESLGFVLVERIRAWVTTTTEHDGLFGTVTETKERKSFFRRLAEAKGSPRIDWEEVIVVRTKP